MRFRTSFVIALTTTGFAAGASAQAFEGVITQKMTAGGMNMDLVIYVKGEKVRQEMNATGMPGGAMIVDPASGDAIMLMTGQKQYMRFPVSETGRQGDARVPEFTATGVKETIAGHSCEHYTVKVENNDVDVCIATGIGTFVGASGANPMGGRRGGGGEGISDAAMRELARQFKGGFFPLKIVSRTERGDATIEVTKIEKKSLSDDLFAIPEGFTEIRMGRGY